MDKELLGKYLRDLHIVTQDEDQEFPYANPSDAARSLIKARNWTGTLTEKLINLNDEAKVVKQLLHRIESNLVHSERLILSRCAPVPGWATKNKEIQKSYVLSNASEEEEELLAGLESDAINTREKLTALESEIDQYNTLIKTLDKTTEWIIQYINWMKYEARSLNA